MTRQQQQPKRWNGTIRLGVAVILIGAAWQNPVTRVLVIAAAVFVVAVVAVACGRAVTRRQPSEDERLADMLGEREGSNR